MLLRIINCALICIIIVDNCYCQTWKWARGCYKEGETNWTSGTSTSTDINGNVYLAMGDWISKIAFPPDTFTAPSSSSPTICFVKYDSSGNVLWTKHTWVYTDAEPQSTCTDNWGNVFFSGWFSGTLNFSFSNSLISGLGGSRQFLVKYDANGNFKWNVKAGNTDDVIPSTIKTDRSGNVYLVSAFDQPEIVLGNDTFVKAGFPGTHDIYIVKYDSSGNIIWAKSAGGIGDQKAAGVALDAAGNIYVTGYTSSIHDTMSISTYKIDSDTGSLFIIKYDSSGNILWAKGYGHNDSFASEITGTEMDSAGNLYITGYYMGTIKLGLTTLYNQSTAWYDHDIFLAKVDPIGNIIWAKRAGGTGDEGAQSLAISSLGNICISGDFDSTIMFDNITLNKPYPNYYPGFIAEYKPDGSPVFATSIKSGTQSSTLTAVRYTNGLSTDKYNNLYIADIYWMSMRIGTDTLVLSQSIDCFLAKMHLPSYTIANTEKTIKSENVELYPSPASTRLYVKFDNSIITNLSVFLYNLTGKQIGSYEINVNNSSIPIEGLSSGIYFCRILINDIVVVKKIIIAR